MILQKWLLGYPLQKKKKKKNDPSKIWPPGSVAYCDNRLLKTFSETGGQNIK